MFKYLVKSTKQVQRCLLIWLPQCLFQHNQINVDILYFVSCFIHILYIYHRLRGVSIIWLLVPYCYLRLPHLLHLECDVGTEIYFFHPLPYCHPGDKDGVVCWRLKLLYWPTSPNTLLVKSSFFYLDTTVSSELSQQSVDRKNILTKIVIDVFLPIVTCLYFHQLPKVKVWHSESVKASKWQFLLVHISPRFQPLFWVNIHLPLTAKVGFTFTIKFQIKDLSENFFSEDQPANDMN